MKPLTSLLHAVYEACPYLREDLAFRRAARQWMAAHIREARADMTIEPAAAGYLGSKQAFIDTVKDRLAASLVAELRRRDAIEVHYREDGLTGARRYQAAVLLYIPQGDDETDDDNSAN